METWKIGHVCEKSGNTWNGQGNVCGMYPSLGKFRGKNYLGHIRFSLTHAWLFVNWLLHSLFVNVNFITCMVL